MHRVTDYPPVIVTYEVNYQNGRVIAIGIHSSTPATTASIDS
jgi:hypothetical protein